MDYIQGLSKLYIAPGFDSKGVQIYISAEEKNQILKTMQDFSSIAKSVKLSNLFLTSFAEVAQLIETTMGSVGTRD